MLGSGKGESRGKGHREYTKSGGKAQTPKTTIVITSKPKVVANPKAQAQVKATEPKAGAGLTAEVAATPGPAAAGSRLSGSDWKD